MKNIQISVRWAFILAAVFATMVATRPLSAQVIDDVDNLDWDRPEAWAMKYFNSVSLLTGLGAPSDRERGSLAFGLELDSIPNLSREQRRIGFGGFKEEDINRLPVLARPRLTVGLGGNVSLDLAWVPPIELKGVEANLFSLGLERPLYRRGALVLGARLSGQIGTVKGDFTCSKEDAADPDGNVWGCEAPSKDELSLDHVSLALTGGYLVRATTLHWGLAATYMDMEFQVNALTAGLHDRTLLLADGWAWSVNAGATWRLTDAVSVGGEFFYSPLSVDRPSSAGSENDGLFNVRTMVRFQL